jgi:hypothetical protein
MFMAWCLVKHIEDRLPLPLDSTAVIAFATKYLKNRCSKCANPDVAYFSILGYAVNRLVELRKTMTNLMKFAEEPLNQVPSE